MAQLNTGSRFVYLILLICAIAQALPYEGAPVNITLIGFFPTNDRIPSGSARATAAVYAVEKINDGSANISLSGIPLFLQNNFIASSPNPQINVLTTSIDVTKNFDARGARNYMIGFLGESSSAVSQTLSIVAGAYDIVQISPSSTSASLSDKNTYKTFARTVASDTFQVLAVIAFFKQNNWRRAGAISTSDAYGSGGVSEFRNLASESIKIVDPVISFAAKANQTLRTQPETAKLISDLTLMKATGVRLIFCHMLATDAKWLFEVAATLDMAGPTNNKGLFTWILTDGSGQTKGINELLDGQAVVIKPVGGFGNEAFDGFNNSNSFVNWWRTADNSTYPGAGTEASGINDYVPFTYDAVFVFAKVFEKMIQKQTLHGNTSAQNILDEIRNLTFTGLTGKIAFDQTNLDRLSDVNYYYVTKNYTANGIPNGNYTVSTKQVYLSPTFWPNGVVPTDGVKDPLKTSLSPVLGSIIFAITVVLMAVTLVFIVLTIVWSEHPRIKAATFSFLIYILVAGLLAYSTIFVLYVEPSDTTCVTPLWFGHTAFFFAFGCLFTKTFRVWMIFSRAKKVSTKKIVIKDEHLLFIVGACTILLWIYLSIWTYLDRPTAQPVDSGVDKEYYMACIPSKAGWYVGIYVLEVLALLVGVFLSFKTRKIELLRFNESSNIAVCIYVLVFLGLIIIPMAHFIHLGQDWTFLVESGGILVATTSVLGFLFVPKFRAIINKKEEMGSTMKKTGSVITPPKESVESGN